MFSLVFPTAWNNLHCYHAQSSCLLVLLILAVFVNNDINKAIHCKLYDNFLSAQLPSVKLSSLPLTGFVICNYCKKTTSMTKSGYFPAF